MTNAADREQVQDLNLIIIGNELVKVAMISRLMGHSSMAGTVRDYLSPHAGALGQEQRFVYDVLLGENPASEEEAVEWLQAVEMPALPDIT